MIEIGSALFASALATSWVSLFSLKRDEKRRGVFADNKPDEAASLEWTDGALRLLEEELGLDDGAIVMMRLVLFVT